jgi:hypothetical protein
MCRFRALVSTFSFAVVASIALPAAAIPIMPDTFEDGTTMGWGVGAQSPLPPQNIADGGPGGPGDAYLELRASGNDAPGGRLSVLNAAQWMGDYLAAGITGIQMDVRNFGPSDLTLRLLLEHFDMPGPPTDVALTVDGVFVPAGGNWTTVVFDLTNLAALPGFGTVEGASLSQPASRLRRTSECDSAHRGHAWCRQHRGHRCGRPRAGNDGTAVDGSGVSSRPRAAEDEPRRI